MKPDVLGKKYDKIAEWWHEQHKDGDYGVAQVKSALKFRTEGGNALDVGCGAGGRIIRVLQKKNYKITGLDVSSEMIRLASENHPGERFIHQDICTWGSEDRFDFIVAWDSIFHLPYDQQESVVAKLCRLLNDDGVLVYSFGNAIGEHADQWRGDTFHYSSVGINENVRLIVENGLTVLHLELDQYPEEHVYVIAKKP
jgi:SAM-dependent methyltransferase